VTSLREDAQAINSQSLICESLPSSEIQVEITMSSESSDLERCFDSDDSEMNLEHFQNTYDLIDIWRIHHPEKKSFTWTQKKPFIKRRLDFWLMSNAVQDNVF